MAVLDDDWKGSVIQLPKGMPIIKYFKKIKNKNKKKVHC